MNVPLSKNKKGFTLVEMVLYVAFFALLSVLAIQATITVMKAFYTLRISQSLTESATTAMERMSREIRNAYDVDSANSTFATSTGRLTVRTKDDIGALSTTEFFLDGQNKLNLKLGGVDQGTLVTKTVSVSSLVFNLITNANTKAVKIEMTISDSRSLPVKSVRFYDTIMLRGTVH